MIRKILFTISPALFSKQTTIYKITYIFDTNITFTTTNRYSAHY